MIEVSSISKTYGARKALDNLSFQIMPGEVVGLLGPNGAGKSTTMKIMTGYMSPSTGSVRLGSVDVFENPEIAKMKVGYLPEAPPVYLDMLVEDYLYFAARLKKVEESKLNDYVQSAILKTNLTSVRSRLIGNLSKGFRQRVGLAQALVNQPEILILDEPTVGLDPKQVAEVRDVINSLRGKHTILLSTHILSEVEAVCDRVIILHNGKMVGAEKISNIGSLQKASTEIKLKVREPLLTEADLLKVAGVQSVVSLSSTVFHIQVDTDRILDQVVALALEKKAGILEVSGSANQLEKMFLDLTYGASLGK